MTFTKRCHTKLSDSVSGNSVVQDDFCDDVERDNEYVINFIRKHYESQNQVVRCCVVEEK